MTTPSRTRAGRTGLLAVITLLVLISIVADLSRNRSFIRGLLAPESRETPAENLVRGVRGGLTRPSR